MIPNLDNTASEIVQYQRDSTVQRKDLAQKTKDFRKLDDAAKLGEVKGLLKGRTVGVITREMPLTIQSQLIKRLSTCSRITRNQPILPSSKFIPRYQRRRIHILYSKPRSTRSSCLKTPFPRLPKKTNIYRKASASSHHNWRKPRQD